MWLGGGALAGQIRTALEVGILMHCSSVLGPGGVTVSDGIVLTHPAHMAANGRHCNLPAPVLPLQ